MKRAAAGLVIALLGGLVLSVYAATVPTKDIIDGHQNRPGKLYDSTKKTILFAEELEAIRGRLVEGIYTVNALDLDLGGTTTINSSRDAFLANVTADSVTVTTAADPDETTTTTPARTRWEDAGSTSYVEIDVTGDAAFDGLTVYDAGGSNTTTLNGETIQLNGAPILDNWLPGAVWKGAINCSACDPTDAGIFGSGAEQVDDGEAAFIFNSTSGRAWIVWNSTGIGGGAGFIVELTEVS